MQYFKIYTPVNSQNVLLYINDALLCICVVNKGLVLYCGHLRLKMHIQEGKNNENRTIPVNFVGKIRNA